MDDLDKLIAAVEAGVVSLHDSDKLFALPRHERTPVRLLASKAYDGSLDAALRLHEALLPGWDYCIDFVQRVKPLVYVQDDGGPTHDGEAGTTARAWLLAILRALKAKGAA